MRIIRLFDGSNQCDLPMAYIHFGDGKETLVNGKPSNLIAAGPGNDVSLKGGDWLIVFSPECPLEEGAFLGVETDGPVFRVNSSTGKYFTLTPVRGGFLGLSQRTALLRPMRVGVLTVSDKGSRGERRDTSGPALSEMVEPLGGVVVQRGIVPDDRKMIAETIRTWSDKEEIHLILVTGGTGLAARDVTPEALGDVADRTVPGLGEAMRRKTEPLLDRSILSRSVAVTRGKCLVIAFPGSEKGVRQCFESISGVLRHGVDILNGWEGECGGSFGHAHFHG